MENDRCILLLGPVGSGKSSTGNSLMGSTRFQIPTKTCEMIIRKSEIINQYLRLVDTPGFGSQDSTPQTWAIEILRFLEACSFKPHAVLLIFKLNDKAADQQQTIEMMKLAFGDQVFKHCIVVFTHPDAVTATEERSLQMVVDKCNGRSTTIKNSATDVAFNIPTEDVKQIMVMVDQVSESGANMFSPQIERRQALEECGSDDLDAIGTSVEEKICKRKRKRIAITGAKYIEVVVATGVVFYCTKEAIVQITKGITANVMFEIQKLLKDVKLVLKDHMNEVKLEAIFSELLLLKPIPEEYAGFLEKGINLINIGATTALLTSGVLKQNPLLLLAGVTWGFGAAATPRITKM